MRHAIPLLIPSSLNHRFHQSLHSFFRYVSNYRPSIFVEKYLMLTYYETMDDFEPIEERVLAVSNGKVVKKRPCMRVPMMVCAIGLLVVALMTERLQLVPDCVARDVGLGMGWLIVVAGLFLFGKCRPQLFEKSTDRPMLHAVFDFESRRMSEVRRLYDACEFEELMQLCTESNGGIQLTLVASEDGSLCFSQLSQYVPYTYVPIEDVRVVGENESVKKWVAQMRGR